MTSGVGLERLIAAKVEALLHDPPHKSWCIQEFAGSGNCNHEERARKFKHEVLAGTILEKLVNRYQKEVKGSVKQADILASGIDRWLLSLPGSLPGKKRSYVVGANIYVNPFNPYIKLDLGKHNIKDLDKKAGELAKKVNEYLKQISSCAEALSEQGVDPVLLSYYILYVLLEILHYEKELPPSLADTRMPTHTIYDHLYATASMLNLLLSGDEPSGYIVLIDVPGIQEFISTSRKVGDYWAASFLLSLTMWKVIEKVIRAMGPDVLISPSPRMNPFVYRFLLESIDVARERLSSIAREECRDRMNSLLDDLKRDVSWFLGALTGGGKLDPYSVSSHALIPATALLVLPKILINELDFRDESRIEATFSRLYSEAWEEVVNDVYSGVEKWCREPRKECVKRRREACVALSIFKLIKNVVKHPPIGSKISIVDVNSVLNKLKECLKGSENSCKEIRAERPPDKSIIEELNKEYSGFKYSTVELLARSLLFHASIQSLASKASKTGSIPVPTPFWIVKDDKIEPQFTTLEKREGERDNWVPCSMCGVEPSVLRLRKRIGEAVDEFNKEDLKRVVELVKETLEEALEADANIIRGVEDIDSSLRLIGFKPGESLGPYCLYKRLFYFVSRNAKCAGGHAFGTRGFNYVRDKIYSTDDISLGYLRKLLMTATGVRTDEKLMDRLSEAICKSLAERFKVKTERDKCDKATLYLITEDAIDVGLAAKQLNLSLEGFKQLLDDAIKSIISDAFPEDTSEESLSSKANEVLKTIYNISEETLNKFGKLVERTGHEYYRYLVKDGLSKANTNYLIVRADGDDVGKLHNGKLPGLNCREYSQGINEALASEGVKFKCNKTITGEECRSLVLNMLKGIHGKVCRIVETLYGQSIPVSPTYKFALSAAVMISAIKDHRFTKQLDGVLAFAGGDDLVAFTPAQKLPLTLGYRLNYAGENYFHKINGQPIAPAIPHGRKMSVRIAELMDLLNEEVQEATTLLEDPAGKIRWRSKHSMREWMKDSLVLSRSRSGARALFPLSIRDVKIPELIAGGLRELLEISLVLLLARILSRNIPEDLDKMYEIDRIYAVAWRHNMPATSIIRVIEHVIDRNINAKNVKNDVINMVLGRDQVLGARSLLDALINVTGEHEDRIFNPLIEYIMGIRLLRVI